MGDITFLFAYLAPALLAWYRARNGMRIAGPLKHAIVPPPLSLRAVAALLGRAQVVFGVDTGLAHLAAAMGVATVGIYRATDPAATGLYGARRAVNVGGRREAPSVAAVLAAWREVQR